MLSDNNNNNNNNDDHLPVLQKGTFYAIFDGASDIVLADMTKRGLQTKERSADETLGVQADKGIIHDMDGIGRQVPIRWYFPKSSFDLSEVSVHADAMEQKYIKLRELTCPD